MKKVLFKTILSLLFITGLGLWFSVFATSLPTSLTKTLDKVVISMDNSRKGLSNNEKRAKYSKVVDFLNKIEPSLNTNQKLVAKYISNAFSQKLAGFVNWNTNDNDILGEPVTQISNVDINKVRQTRLSRHNEVRASKGLYAYQRDPQLEATAHNRSSVLASRNLIDHSSHKRNLSDSYYNYSKILSRFSNLGVRFDETNGTAFAENVAYQYYSCDKADCTQDLINAIKKGRDFFMSEASYNGPHYRGIMSSNFTDIGMGVAFIGKRYWIVTHYGRR